jgi:hypothetical protein
MKLTTKQYIMNKDVKLKLFSWAWVTTDPEKFRVYNALLDDFLAKKEVAQIKFRPKVLYHWHLYAGALQDYVLNGKSSEVLEKLVKKCPLPKRELKRLFY